MTKERPSLPCPACGDSHGPADTCTQDYQRGDPKELEVLRARERVINQWLAPESSVDDLFTLGVKAERAMWLARDCLYSYLKYGDWDEQEKYGTRAAFEALTEALIPDE